MPEDERRSHRTIYHRFQQIEAIYEQVKNWIIFAALILLAVVMYVGDLGPWGSWLLPIFVVCAAGIVFEMLRGIENVVSSGRRQQFQTLTAATSLIGDLVAKKRDRIVIDVIAGPGGTTLHGFLPTFCAANAEAIEINLIVANPDGPAGSLCPRHWAEERALTLSRLSDYPLNNHVVVRVYEQDVIPIVRGIMVNREALVLGFFQWAGEGDKLQLRGAEKPHIYCNGRQSDDGFFFELFRNWFERGRPRLIAVYPPRANTEGLQLGELSEVEPLV